MRRKIYDLIAQISLAKVNYTSIGQVCEITTFSHRRLISEGVGVSMLKIKL